MKYSASMYVEIRQVLDDIFEAAYDKDICNFSRAELADSARLHYSTIYGLETNKYRVPSFGTIMKLCKAVRMDTQFVQLPLPSKVKKPKLKIIKYK